MVNLHSLKFMKNTPLLSSEEEMQLICQWQTLADSKAAHQILTAYQKLVIKIALRYRGYGLPLNDLVSEGNVGMMHALKHFDTTKGFRLSTYATFWIRATIQDYILQSWSLVKIATTKPQKRLFFKLIRTHETVRKSHENDEITPEVINAIAEKLDVTSHDVSHMMNRMHKDKSLHKGIPESGHSKKSVDKEDWIVDESSNQEETYMAHEEVRNQKSLLARAYQSLTPRQIDILHDRYLTEPTLTLEQIAIKHHLSIERVRQIEQATILKLQKTIRNLSFNNRLN